MRGLGFSKIKTGEESSADISADVLLVGAGSGLWRLVCITAKVALRIELSALACETNVVDGMSEVVSHASEVLSSLVRL